MFKVQGEQNLNQHQNSSIAFNQKSFRESNFGGRKINRSFKNSFGNLFSCVVKNAE